MSGLAAEHELQAPAIAPIGDGAAARPRAAGLARALRRPRGRAWKDALRRRLLAAADALAVIAAAVATGFVGDERSTALVCATLPVWIVVAKVNGLYDRDHTRLRHQTVDELSGIFHAVTISAALTLVALALVPGTGLSLQEALLLWGVAFAATFLLRGLARRAWRALVAPERGLVVGSGELATALARKLELERGHHVRLAGRLAIPGGVEAADGPLHALEDGIAAGRYERVILALEDLDEATVARVVGAGRAAGVKVSVAPPLRATLGTAVQLNHLAELPLIEFRTWDPSRSTMALKRAVDVAGAAVALTLTAPLLLAALAAIRIESPGSPLFRQRRAGRYGVPFTMLKLRTMVADAEARLGDVVDVDGLAEPVFKLAADPRVTRVGRLLRRLSLDELPQLVNVLRGDMSLVGPRPEEVWLTRRYSPAEAVRLSVRPGITGPMQVHGRGELTLEERVAVEREYIENYSLRKDLDILLRTGPAVLAGQGAY
ncbi:MAG: exopolysaccharide biosynthesis polyprenyl glycosylphosphotransferase [Solirubrobacterales bacterium]|nr:exopolysaccharide biosynthesis polyprenyl glycosylphosphotransferase [Solirubrobacterales bacterium]